MIGVTRQLHIKVRQHIACVASVSVRLRSKKRGTRVKDRVKKRASRGGDVHREFARIFWFTGSKNFSFRILYVLLSYYMYFASKTFF